MKKLFILSIAFVLCFSTGFSQITSADAQAAAESIVELISKTTWPGASSPGEGAVKICVIGDTPVKGALEGLTADAKRPFEVTQVALGDDLSGYHLAFNPSGEISSLAKVLKAVGGGKVLTVSAGKDFARYGVMVNLNKDGGSIKFEINTMVLDGSGIKIDDSILKKATKI